MTTTPIHRRIVVVLAVLVVTISCSNLVDAIRLTGDRGLKVSTRVTANTTIRRSNNKALLLLNIRGGDDSVVSVIPDATLPRAIAGMSVPAFQFQQQNNDNDNGDGNDNDNNEHVDSYNNSDFDVRGHVQDTTNTNYVSLTHPPPSSVVTSSHPDTTTATTTTTTTLQLHHVLRREGGGEDEASADNVAVAAAAVTVPSPPDLAMKSAKWNGLKTRILSTIGIISSLGGLSYFFKEDGLSVFVVVLQAMMYREMTRTIGGDDWGTSLANVRKYWWFVTAVIAWNGPRLYPWKRGLLEAIAFTMTISTGLLTTILGFQYNRNGNIEFREYIRQTAVSLFSAALVVLPSYTTCPKTSDDKKEKQLLLLLYLFKNIETKIETKIKVIHHSLNLFTLYLIYFFNYCIHVHNVTVMLLYVTFFSCYSFSRSKSCRSCLILFRSLYIYFWFRVVQILLFSHSACA